MTEKQISLEGIDPAVFYGPNNRNLNLLSGSFGSLKIVARGHILKVMGEENLIKEFEDKVNAICDHIASRNELGEEDLRLLLEGGEAVVPSGTGLAGDILVYGNSGRPVQARTVNQKLLVEDVFNNDLVLAVGPAGTGKTYTTIALAVRALKNREVRRIVLTRPAVEAGEHLGFLPGDMKDKLDPYLQPLYDALRDMVPAKKLENYIEDQVIQIAPIAFMRGRTLENAFVVMDEAQNATHNQLKMFLTRMGMNSKFVITGDVTQVDLPRRGDSGLILAMKVLRGLEGISVIEFDERDMVRHKLVKDIVRAYEDSGKGSDKPADSGKGSDKHASQGENKKDHK